MEIPQTDGTRRSKPVLVRLTPDLVAWLESLAQESGGGVATVVRSIIEAAKKEGVEVVERQPEDLA